MHLPPVPGHPPSYHGQARGTVFEVFLRLARWPVGGVPSLAACWGFCHLGLVAKQRDPRRALALDLQSGAAAEGEASRPLTRVMVRRFQGEASESSCHHVSLDTHSPGPSKGSLSFNPKITHSEPSGFLEVEGSMSGS